MSVIQLPSIKIYDIIPLTMIKAVQHFIMDVLRTTGSFIRNLLVFFCALFLLLIFVSFLSGILIQGTGSTTSTIREVVVRNENGEDKIVVVKLSGLILSEASTGLLDPTETVITPLRVQNALNQVKKDPLAKAVIFDINSPGGSPVASDRIFELISNFKNDTKIPVVFLMGDMAASGGYYIASAANHIVANPATITGSIGVILESYNLEELYKKIGVAKNTFKQGQYKDILNEARPLTDEERKIIESLNENTYNLFISRVAQGRQLPEEQIRSIATGQIYSGRQAKELQLVDSLGNIDEAIYQAKSLANLDRFQVIEYESTSFFKEIFSETFSAFSPSVQLRYMLETAFPPLQQR